VTSLTSSTLARAGARSLIKLVPGLGTLIGGVTVSVFNGASTFALGEVFKKHFQSGGTILDFDVDRLKKVYREKFEKGKDVADQLRKEEGGMKKRESQPSDESSTAKMDSGAANDAVIARIKELASMKDQGIISEEEFQEMKKKLIEGL
jgi:hypothetical protein